MKKFAKKKFYFNQNFRKVKCMVRDNIFIRVVLIIRGILKMIFFLEMEI
jgi:hypothetical protein